jgi:hypothetical protein
MQEYENGELSLHNPVSSEIQNDTGDTKNGLRRSLNMQQPVEGNKKVPESDGQNSSAENVYERGTHFTEKNYTCAKLEMTSRPQV